MSLYIVEKHLHVTGSHAAFSCVSGSNLQFYQPVVCSGFTITSCANIYATFVALCPVDPGSPICFVLL